MERFELLTKLSRYEDAYKNAIRFAQAQINAEGNIVQLNSPLLDLVRHYQQLVKKTREQLRDSLNE